MRWLGLPFTLLFGLVLRLRHLLYNSQLLKSRPTALPSIAIGNLSLGGSGKTPMTELLIALLSNRYKVAMLSRGYGRRTKGFRWVEVDDSSLQVGDEPLQVKRKFPHILVAVCENRHHGIDQLSQSGQLDLVILDDALQHRAILPDIRILLTSAARPFWCDFLFPVGKLRDLRSRSSAADAWVITKCGDNQEELAQRAGAQRWANGIPIFTSTVQYGEPQFNHAKPSAKIRKVIGLAGLADSRDFEAYLRSQYEVIEFISFRDHHAYSLSEITRIWDEHHTFADAMITTEKDWMRFSHLQIPANVVYGFIPIQTSMHDQPKFQHWLFQQLNTLIPHHVA